MQPVGEAFRGSGRVESNLFGLVCASAVDTAGALFYGHKEGRALIGMLQIPKKDVTT